MDIIVNESRKIFKKTSITEVFLLTDLQHAIDSANINFHEFRSFNQ